MHTTRSVAYPLHKKTGTKRMRSIQAAIHPRCLQFESHTPICILPG